MSGQPVLDLFEVAPEAIVPCCARCGAVGERIEVDGLAVRDLYAASQFALLAIWDHEREMHGRVLCSGCGLLMGTVRSNKDFAALEVATRGHVGLCAGGSVLVREGSSAAVAGVDTASGKRAACSRRSRRALRVCVVVDEEIRVPVKSWHRPADFRALVRLADVHKVTVGELVVECVRRQLAGALPEVKKPASSPRTQPWGAVEEAEFDRLYARGWSDNRIAQHMGRAQSTVSRSRRLRGLPALFAGRKGTGS